MKDQALIKEGFITYSINKTIGEHLCQHYRKR